MKWNFKLPKLGKLAEKLGKYKYAVILAAIGIVLLLWPTSPKQPTPAPEQPTDEEPVEDLLTTSLRSALEKIEGAGKIELVLAWGDNGEVVYHTDTSVSKSDGTESQEQSTVTVQSGSSHYDALVVQNRSPTCTGALVVCEGADLAAVRLRIITAVAALTGLGSDQIAVVKMKS